MKWFNINSENAFGNVRVLVAAAKTMKSENRNKARRCRELFTEIHNTTKNRYAGSEYKKNIYIYRNMEHNNNS